MMAMFKVWENMWEVCTAVVISSACATTLWLAAIWRKRRHAQEKEKEQILQDLAKMVQDGIPCKDRFIIPSKLFMDHCCRHKSQDS